VFGGVFFLRVFFSFFRGGERVKVEKRGERGADDGTDSLVSSLLFSFILHSPPPQKKNETNTQADTSASRTSRTSALRTTGAAGARSTPSEGRGRWSPPATTASPSSRTRRRTAG